MKTCANSTNPFSCCCIKMSLGSTKIPVNTTSLVLCSCASVYGIGSKQSQHALSDCGLKCNTSKKKGSESVVTYSKFGADDSKLNGKLENSELRPKRARFRYKSQRFKSKLYVIKEEDHCSENKQNSQISTMEISEKVTVQRKSARLHEKYLTIDNQRETEKMDKTASLKCTENIKPVGFFKTSMSLRSSLTRKCTTNKVADIQDTTQEQVQNKFNTQQKVLCPKSVGTKPCDFMAFCYLFVLLFVISWLHCFLDMLYELNWLLCPGLSSEYEFVGV